MDFTIISSPAGAHQTTGYSHAAQMGDLLFISGQVALNEAGELVGKGDPLAQTEQIYQNLQAVLEASGSGLELVGKLNVLITDLDHLAAVRQVRDRVFAPVGHLPASTLAVISGLANPDFLVEIEAIAMIRR